MQTLFHHTVSSSRDFWSQSLDSILIIIIRSRIFGHLHSFGCLMTRATHWTQQLRNWATLVGQTRNKPAEPKKIFTQSFWETARVWCSEESELPPSRLLPDLPEQFSAFNSIEHVGLSFSCGFCSGFCGGFYAKIAARVSRSEFSD